MPRYEVWDRQPLEASKAYALFANYRDAGPLERTLVRVAREFGRSTKTIEYLTRRYNWVPRVQAWDQENERIKRASQIKGLESMARRQVLAGQLMMSRGLKRLQSMTDEEVQLLSVWEATRLVESGTRLERSGYGAPEEFNQTNVQINVGDSTIGEILRRNPTRVGPIISMLEELRKAVPELSGGESVYYDPVAEDEDLAQFLASVGESDQEGQGDDGAGEAE